jgi:hypothetical protein
MCDSYACCLISEYHALTIVITNNCIQRLSAHGVCAKYVRLVSVCEHVTASTVSEYHLSNCLLPLEPRFILSTTEYEVVSKIFRTDFTIYTAVVVARSTVDGRTTMSSESVCQVARSWVDVGSFHTRLVVRFMNFTASVRNILDTASCLTS